MYEVVFIYYSWSL